MTMIKNGVCPLCGRLGADRRPTPEEGLEFDLFSCHECGTFAIERRLLARWSGPSTLPEAQAVRMCSVARARRMLGQAPPWFMVTRRYDRRVPGHPLAMDEIFGTESASDAST
jgi:hypothetical protein